jgi:repressor LexA
MLLYAMSISELDSKQAEAVKHIRNFINNNGRMPSVRELMLAMEYKSPRSASVMLDKLVHSGVLNRCPQTRKLNFNDGVLALNANTSTVEVPLIGTTSCSGPIFAEESIEAFYRISSQLAPSGSQYFFLKIQGDSMDLAGITPGDMVLIRQQNTAKPGDLVLALIDDEATIKKYVPEDGLVILKPCSSNPEHNPIILTHDFQIQGVVVRSFSNL